MKYEQIFETLKKEKTDLDLQKLSENFFEEANKFLEDKTKLFNQTISEKETDINFVQKIQKEIINIKSMINLIHCKRERKILIHSMQFANDQDIIINYDKMTPEELKLFNNISDTVLKHIKNRKL